MADEVCRPAVTLIRRVLPRASLGRQRSDESEVQKVSSLAVFANRDASEKPVVPNAAPYNVTNAAPVEGELRIAMTLDVVTCDVVLLPPMPDDAFVEVSVTL